MMYRYYARSASDNTDDWPFWFVADRRFGGLNRTGELCDSLGIGRRPGQTLTTRELAERIASAANEDEESKK